MYPISIPKDKHVPFSISTDEHVPLRFLMKKYLQWLIIDIFNNKHITAFENNIYWYIHKYLEIKDMQVSISLVLQTLMCPYG